MANQLNPLIKLGQIFFAIPMMVFGFQYIGYGRYAGGLPPVPPWAPGGAIGAYLVGAILIATAVGIATKKIARISALIIGGLCLFCVVFLQLLHLHNVVYNGVDRTRALEPLALGAAAFALAALLPAEGLSAGTGSNDRLLLFGRIVFGISMAIFGIQHFMYAPFLATLVMPWLPGHLFWIYFTGASMVLAGLAIASSIKSRIAGLLLGLMFFLWVVLLHAPRVLAQLHNQDELTSLFVALAFSGSSLIFAAASNRD